MYSVVLAAVLTTGTAAPDWHMGFGCYGCHGCSGCTGCTGCYGCWGCCGGCYGCYGCCGGCYGCGGSYAVAPYNFYSCSGGWSCWGCWGSGVVVQPVIETPRLPKPRTELAPPGRAATVTVTLPGEARLYVDDVPYPAKQDKITFETPKLDAERTYYYTLKAELVRDGKVYRESRRVDVAAGKEAKVEFKDLQTAQAVQR